MVSLNGLTLLSFVGPANKNIWWYLRSDTHWGVGSQLDWLYEKSWAIYHPIWHNLQKINSLSIPLSLSFCLSLSLILSSSQGWTTLSLLSFWPDVQLYITRGWIIQADHSLIPSCALFPLTPLHLCRINRHLIQSLLNKVQNKSFIQLSHPTQDVHFVIAKAILSICCTML